MTKYFIRSDMELDQVYDIPTKKHSRTRLKEFSHVPGHMTVATMRLQGGKGDVQYPKAWIDWTIQVLNKDNPHFANYFYHKDAGIQNSATRGRCIEAACEGNVVDVISVSGDRHYVRTFHVGDQPPAVADLSDPRIQRFTVVTYDDQLIDSPKGRIYFPLMARATEELWILGTYLKPYTVTPPAPARKLLAIARLAIYTDGTELLGDE